MAVCSTSAAERVSCYSSSLPFFSTRLGSTQSRTCFARRRGRPHERGITHVEWIRGSADKLQKLAPALGLIDLVTIGTAFHFLEPRDTLSELRRAAAGASVAVAYNGSPMWLHRDPWAKALRGVLETRLGQLRDVDFTAEALQAAEDAMRVLGYTEIERWEQTHIETIDVDFVIGHILSATTTDQIPASQRDEFGAEVSSAICRVDPSGRVAETVSVRAVIGRANRTRHVG